MNRFLIVLSTVCVLATGCSFSSSNPTSKSEEPRYQAVIAVESRGGKCASDMSSKGMSACDVVEANYRFIEHREGSDYYELVYKVDGEEGIPINKTLTFGFDGERETIVSEAEPFIAIRKGPLHPELSGG